jgi:hypothetical protein
MLRRMMLAVVVMAAVFGPAGLARAQAGVNIGLQLGSAPPLAAVPESPVMYAPTVNGNFFFYQGEYYIFRKGAWYMAPRHNGPWAVVSPEYVPRPLLAVPVRYYKAPPPEWNGWRAEAAPRWQTEYGRRWHDRGDHVWEERRVEHREVLRDEDLR